MEDNNNLDNNQSQESSSVEPQQSSAETIAYKELYEQQQAELEKIRKENSELKVANAKLAIQQTLAEPKDSPEELLNKMFN